MEGEKALSHGGKLMLKGMLQTKMGKSRMAHNVDSKWTNKKNIYTAVHAAESLMIHK